MGVIVYPKRRAHIPYGSSIDWGHPLANGLVMCATFHEGVQGGRELVYNRQYTSSNGGALSSSMTPAGQGLSCTAGHPALVVGSTDVWNATTRAVSVFAFFALTPLDNIRTQVGKYNADTGLGGWHLAIYAGFQGFYVYVTGGWQGLQDNTIDVQADPTYHKSLGVYDGSSVRLYVDGRQNVAPVAASGLVAANTVPLVIGYIAGNTPDRGWNFFLGKVVSTYVWHRALTYNEAQWLHAEPFAMLVPQSPRVRYWLPAAAPPAGTGARSQVIIIG